MSTHKLDIGPVVIETNKKNIFDFQLLTLKL